MPFTPPKLLSPQRWKHKKIGLFGGTFNPPHEGHIHVCHTALRQQKFDFIWWMVTPQNPLKKDQDIPPFEQRIRWSETAIDHPKIIITDIEKQLKTYKSIDTIKSLKNMFPETSFTFIAGMDNAENLHKWEEWNTLITEVPFLFIARPPALNLVKNYPSKMINHNNIEWIFTTKMVDQSSTQIRALSDLVEKQAK